MRAFRSGRLEVRRNLHVGVGFLAATSGGSGPGRLCFRTVRTRRMRLSTLEAGIGPPVLAIHGLGATKGSFLFTVAALAGHFRVIAVDLPGFGDSDKPIGAAYDAPFFAEVMIDLLDALELDRADLLGNSLGGRVAFARHVAEGLPQARQLELDCGHVPQMERPRQTHEALAAFLAGGGSPSDQAR